MIHVWNAFVLSLALFSGLGALQPESPPRVRLILAFLAQAALFAGLWL